MELRIREMNSQDWLRVAEIYEAGIKTELSTFQSEVPSWEDWDSGHLSSCRIVALAEEKVVGWAALSAFSPREVFRGVAEESVYIAEEFKGRGIGKMLMNCLIEESEKAGFWTLMARIISENNASIELHKKCGFREVGYREKIGRMKNGRWHDVVVMERRSKKVGV